jgi:hypothetical protein
MANETLRAQGGTVLRGADGSIYFVRDELLPALKVEGEGLQRLQKELGGKAEAAAKPAQGLASASYLKGDLLDKDPPAWTVHMTRLAAPEIGRIRQSTIMCPWFC